MTRAGDNRSLAGGEPPPGDRRAVTVGAYIALLLLGAVEALIGVFQYSRGAAGLVAIGFALAIGLTCILGGWGMRTAAGGVLPAVGWFVVALILGASGAGGSVLVTDTAAGKWFLFGGAVCAAAGAIVAFAKWSRPSHSHRSAGGQAGGPGRAGRPR